MSTETIPSHLPRGRACTACRNRKMKCDGNAPTCNQCLRFNRAHECLFVPGPAPSNTRMLEQEVQRLQDRIQRLETRDPSSAGQGSQGGFPANWWEHSEPPRNVARTLVEYFLPHAPKFGFFLDPQRFMAFFSSSSATVPRPSGVLRQAVYLWGIHLSQRSEIMAYENVFLDRAVRSVVAALSMAQQQPATALYVLQAEILLAYYFLSCNRLVEGQHHTSGAVSLAFVLNLHKIQPGRHMGGALPPPAGSTEERERVTAWWQTFILEKCWTTAMKTPSVIDESKGSGSAIDTPWPPTVDSHGQVMYSRPGRTVQNFLADVSSDRSNSALALHAKASALYERASYVASLQSRNPAEVAGMVSALDAAIETFRRSLPTVAQSGALNTPGAAHEFALTTSLVNGATIMLYRCSASQSSTARSKVVCAANMIARALQVAGPHAFKSANPILAITSTSAGEILASALRSLRRSGTVNTQGEDTLVFGLNELQKVMNAGAADSPLFANQLSKLMEAQASLR